MPSSANPILSTVEAIRGYPSTLKLFKCAESRYWQVQAYLHGVTARRSTRTENHAEAVTFAKNFYNELLLKHSQNQPLTQGMNFEHVVLGLLKEDEGRVARGERKQSVVRDGEYIFNTHLIPFFRRDNLRNITYQRINEYVQDLHKDNVSSQTIKHHFVYLRKALKYAYKTGKLDKLPIFPTISTRDNPREWFNEQEFELLQKTIKKAIADKVVIRSHVIGQELMDLTHFMVNTFLRPQDIKLLQHKHIVIVTKLSSRYLRIMALGKTKPAPVISTEAAVPIYERLKGEPEDFVFQPQFTNRTHAMSVLSRQFDYVLKKAELKESPTGGQRTLYSLRHTCIMNQLLYGKWSLFTLARNCRTSPEMIDRFYGSHLEAEMSVEQMAQTVEAEDTLENLFEDNEP